MNKYLNNDLLMLGITFLIVGIAVGSYSYSTYNEVKKLDSQIDFEMIDNNNSISTSEKYNKYIAFADFLNQKLAKNQNIPIKNTACVYLDYAQHNAIELYNLTDTKMDIDESKKIIAAENIRGLYNMLGNYKTCKKSATYKQELSEIIQKIEKKQNIKSEYVNYYIDINEQKIFEQELKIDLSQFSSILNRKTAKTDNDIRYIEMFRNACKQYLTL